MECKVCYEEKKCMTFSCNHSVCKICYIKSGKTTCPFCRKEVITELDEETQELTKYVQSLNKEQTNLEEEVNIATYEADELEEECDTLIGLYETMRQRYRISKSRCISLKKKNMRLSRCVKKKI